MEEKPLCYDSVPACLCMSCQLYDVRQMVKAKSTVVSSRSPFLPSYAASLLYCPSSKSVAPAASSAVYSRPSCTVAATTSGLASIDDFSMLSVPKPVCEPGCFPCCSYLSRPCLDFVDSSSSPCFLPNSVSAVGSVAASPSRPVPSVASASPVRLSPSLVSSTLSSPVCSVSASPVRCQPSLVNAAPPGPVGYVSASSASRSPSLVSDALSSPFRSVRCLPSLVTAAPSVSYVSASSVSRSPSLVSTALSSPICSVRCLPGLVSAASSSSSSVSALPVRHSPGLGSAAPSSPVSFGSALPVCHPHGLVSVASPYPVNPGSTSPVRCLPSLVSAVLVSRPVCLAVPVLLSTVFGLVVAILPVACGF